MINNLRWYYDMCIGLNLYQDVVEKCYHKGFKTSLQSFNSFLNIYVPKLNYFHHDITMFSYRNKHNNIYTVYDKMKSGDEILWGDFTVSDFASPLGRAVMVYKGLIQVMKYLTEEIDKRGLKIKITLGYYWNYNHKTRHISGNAVDFYIIDKDREESVNILKEIFRDRNDHRIKCYKNYFHLESTITRKIQRRIISPYTQSPKAWNCIDKYISTMRDTHPTVSWLDQTPQQNLPDSLSDSDVLS